MSNIINLSQGDWIKCFDINGCRILTIGRSYKVEEILYINDPTYTSVMKLVVVKNDLGDLGRYTLDRFELDIIKTRSESINEILE